MDTSDLDCESCDSSLGPAGAQLSDGESDLGPLGAIDDGSEAGGLAASEGSEGEASPAAVVPAGLPPQQQLAVWFRAPVHGLTPQLSRLFRVGAPITRRAGALQDIAKIKDLTAGPTPRRSAPLGVEADRLGMHHEVFKETLIDFAASSTWTAKMICQGTFGQISSMLARGYQAVVAMTTLSYDETPILLRGKEKTKEQAEKATFKVLQVGVGCSFIVRPPGGGKCTQIHVPIPDALNCMDHCTAENTAACLRSAVDVPDLKHLLKSFKRVIHTSCSDRAATNNKAEAGKHTAFIHKT